MEKKKFFYGYVIIIAYFLVQMTISTWVHNFFFYFQPVVCQALNESIVVFSLAGTSGAIAGVLFGILFAPKEAKSKIRYWVLIGGIIAAVCIWLMGSISAAWQIIILNFVAQLGIGALLYVPMNILINSWFNINRGTMVAITYMGQGVGGFLFTSTAATIITTNWRVGFEVVAYITLGVALILPWFLKTAEEKGMQPLMPKEGVKEKKTYDAVWGGMMRKQALKTPAFYLYFIVTIFAGAIIAGTLTQAPTFYIESGFDYVGPMMVYSFVSIFSFFACGFIFDKIGIRKGGVITCIMMAAGFIILLLLPSLQSQALAMVGMGVLAFGIVSCNLYAPLLAGILFGKKDYGAIYGLGFTGYTTGCLIGPILLATLRAVTGSWAPSWIVFLVFVVLLVVFTFISMGMKSRLVKRYAETDDPLLKGTQMETT